MPLIARALFLAVVLVWATAALAQQPADKAAQDNLAAKLFVQLSQTAPDDQAAQRAILQKIIDQCPDSGRVHEAYWRLNDIYMNVLGQPDYPAIVDLLEKYLARYPKSSDAPQARRQLVEAYAKIGRWAPVAAYFDQSLGRTPDVPDSELFQDGLVYAQALEQVGRVAEARAWYQKIVARDGGMNSAAAKTARQRLSAMGAAGTGVVAPPPTTVATGGPSPSATPAPSTPSSGSKIIIEPAEPEQPATPAPSTPSSGSTIVIEPAEPEQPATPAPSTPSSGSTIVIEPAGPELPPLPPTSSAPVLAPPPMTPPSGVGCLVVAVRSQVDLVGRAQAAPDGAPDSQLRLSVPPGGKVVLRVDLRADQGRQGWWSTATVSGAGPMVAAIKAQPAAEPGRMMRLEPGAQGLELDLFVQDNATIGGGNQALELVVFWSDGTLDIVPLRAVAPAPGQGPLPGVAPAPGPVPAPGQPPAAG